VLAYARSPFGEPVVPPPVLPLADEAHVADWRRYASEAGGEPFAYLQTKLPQLLVPIREGVSKTDAYGAVARRGESGAAAELGEPPALARPAELRLHLHEHPAGALPVLATPCREDFELLVRAFACRSEPEPVSPSVNAQTVAGFINWERVARYREEWTAGKDAFAVELGWSAERSRVAKQEPWRFQDRLMLTCARPYSDCSAAELGLGFDEAEWLRRSDLLRVEHEFTHYATKRVFGKMSLNLLDEALCDCLGATLALGRFEAAWFLRFLGLEAFPEVRAQGRIHTYVKPLEGEAFRLVCALAVEAAAGLERIAAQRYDPAQRGRFLLALCRLDLELLASPQALELFDAVYARAEALVRTEALRS